MSAETRPLRYAGPYTEGEIPIAFTVKFDPTDIDFTGFVLKATRADQDGNALTFNGSVSWSDITSGIVLVNLAAADVTRVVPTAGHETHRLMIWAGDGGTNRVATVLIKYGIDAPVGVPPSI